jgi:hypothetical protein
MSICPFDVVIHWNEEYEELSIEKEYVKTPLLDHERKPIRGTSVLDEECTSAGIDYWFKECFEGKKTGLYRVKGSFQYSQDYYGDWDSGCQIDYFEKVRRKICKAI